MRLFFYIVILQSLIFAANSQVNVKEIQKLTASNANTDDQFGFRVAIDNTTIVVGVPEYNSRRGKAYIYEYNATSQNYSQVAQLRANLGQADDSFGTSVAVSGDIVVIGASGSDNGGSDTGAVYIYVKPQTGWKNSDNEDATLITHDGGSYDMFGSSVAIENDTIVVGSYDNYNTGENSGAVYIYVRVGASWIDKNVADAKLSITDNGTDDDFGFSVAISGDTIVAGAPSNDSLQVDAGAAYVFIKPNGGWVDANQTAKLTANDGESYDSYGDSVSISNDTVVVGAYRDNDRGYASGSIYVYTKPNSGWIDANQTAKLNTSDGNASDHLGLSVSISGDTILSGTNLNDAAGYDSGAAYLFVKPENGWIDNNETTKIIASDGASWDDFGFNVAISNDIMVIGADTVDTDMETNAGAAYIFEKQDSSFNPSIIMYLLN